jgi:hypothetical protein
MAYLYTHTRLDNGVIFYVGIGTQDNFKRASFSYNRTIHWKNIAKKCGWRADILFDSLSWEDACLKEKELILKYGRLDLGSGTLVNMTNGGDGLNGIKFSKESIIKRNESRRKNGWVVSKERKIKQSIAMIGKNCKKIINTQTGKIYNSIEEAAKDIGISRTGLSKRLTGKIKNKTELTYLL